VKQLQPGLAALCLAVVAIVLDGVTAAERQQSSRERGPEKNNMELVGYHDLQGRSAYQPLVHGQGGRWIAYVGHHGDLVLNPLTGKEEHNGTSILDVSDPKQPKYLAHIPGEPGKAEAGGAQMVRVCDGTTLPHADRSKTYLLRTAGNAGHEIWDVTDPAKPARLTVIVSGLRGTHKNWWECDTGIAYLVSGAPGWRTPRMTLIYDLSDPAKPELVRAVGTGPAAGCDGPGADRSPRPDLHRSERQSRVLRIRHEQGRDRANRRSAKAAGGAKGADR